MKRVGHWILAGALLVTAGCLGRSDLDELICHGPACASASASAVTIPTATFTMGSPTTEQGRNLNEDQHQVTLTHKFVIARAEVRQAEFESLMGWNPSTFPDCADCPADGMSWYDAAAYMNQLTLQEGGTPCYAIGSVTCASGGVPSDPTDYMACMNSVAGGVNAATVTLNGVTSTYDCTGFRLPTEAEWEYAARAGDPRATYNGDLTAADLAGNGCSEPDAVLDPIAWFCGNASRPNVTGSLRPNSWGLYDMLGNVWEWCWDWYDTYGGTVTDPEGPASGSVRVARGGRFFDGASFARAAFRLEAPPNIDLNVGLRVTRSLSP